MYKKITILKSIRTSMENGVCLTNSILKAGLRSPQTVENWRNKSSRIDRYIEALKSINDNKRNAMVEDAFFKRLMEGSGSAADYIFYLTNRLPNRWADKRAVVNNTLVNTIKNENNPITNLTETELKELVKNTNDRNVVT